jgi:gamma-glutamylcyclotransferase (GGCT)/AIG2-like uncharacterized protein YtfP
MKSGAIGRALVAREKRRKKKSPKPCPSGQVRNPKTERCRKNKYGYELNPETGRWRKKCSSGWKRYEKTGRCRKEKGDILVFVYGTLMKGFDNHAMMKGAKYLGLAQTVNKYLMTEDNYPFVNENVHEHKIFGELYNVSTSILETLDLLEGYISPEHPDNLYYRKYVTVINGEQEQKAYMYFNNDHEHDEEIPDGDYKTFTGREFYFAYGSNMDTKRMYERVDEDDIYSISSATLYNYKLVFNKKAMDSGYAYANVAHRNGELVEGVLYEVEDGVIDELDRYEGYPNYYTRKVLKVDVGGFNIPAVVYIAAASQVKDRLKIDKNYMRYLLKAKQYLSKNYYKMLLEFKTS